jgi:hypothetical protein
MKLRPAGLFYGDIRTDERTDRETHDESNSRSSKFFELVRKVSAAEACQDSALFMNTAERKNEHHLRS